MNIIIPLSAVAETSPAETSPWLNLASRASFGSGRRHTGHLSLQVLTMGSRESGDGMFR